MMVRLMANVDVAHFMADHNCSNHNKQAGPILGGEKNSQSGVSAHQD
jgi:hypothetical protein